MTDVTAAAVKALHDALCEAMVAGDAAALDKILTADFTLTHMTGYVQSKSEWLDDIETGQMQYHRMETVEVTVSAEGPELTARTLTDATIWGSRVALEGSETVGLLRITDPQVTLEKGDI